MDEGCGILQSLKQNENYKIHDDENANELALQPGVTRTFGSALTGDIWQNSGYGLYVASSLCLLGGHFILSSGKNAIFLNPGGRNSYFSASYGTTICLSLDMDKIKHVSAIIDTIVKEGESKAKSYHGRVLSASKISSIASIIDKIP